MRTIAFICTLALCMSVCAQQVKEDTLWIGNHAYQKYEFPDWIILNRIPKDTVVFNKDSWKEYYNAHSITAEPKDIVKKHAWPYVKGEKIFIDLKLLFNLQGKLIYTEYSYPKENDVIPIDVLNKIDTELREKVKTSVERFRRDTEKDIHNIELNLYFSISSEDADKQ